MNSPAPSVISELSSNLDIDRRAIVLAGGSGTRLWPLSRATMPKQLLALNGKESLLQDTMRRLLPMVKSHHVTTVTHIDHRFEVAGQLHVVDAGLADHVLAEPIGRNTLPAIAWATACIAREHPAAIIGVFSSDHGVADVPAFHAAWRAAEHAASQGQIALFGMEPTEPATGFGYIQAGDELKSGATKHLPVRKRTAFRRKTRRRNSRKASCARQPLLERRNVRVSCRIVHENAQRTSTSDLRFRNHPRRTRRADCKRGNLQGHAGSFRRLWRAGTQQQYRGCPDQNGLERSRQLGGDLPAKGQRCCRQCALKATYSR